MVIKITLSQKKNLMPNLPGGSAPHRLELLGEKLHLGDPLWCPKYGENPRFFVWGCFILVSYEQG